MNGYDYSKEYGPHRYRGDGTSDCTYECGCSAGDFNVHGPAGLDPVGGECPGNPKDGKRVGGSADYDIVVTRRIKKLESRALAAEELLKDVSPSKKKLVEEIRVLRRLISERNLTIAQIAEAVPEEFKRVTRKKKK